MTDLGPMQPDYRRRMEAAIAKAEDFEGRYETSHASRMHAEECWRREKARAEAAEQRVVRLEAELAIRVDQIRDWNAACKAAEAREQALRDRVTELADEWDARAEVREASMRTTLAPIRDGAELAVFDKGANRLRALLSPEPTEQRGKS